MRDSGTSPSDYDLILTGDLGFTGSKLLYELFEKEHGIDLRPFHNDCGLMIYDLKGQDVNSGGSGCGCSASVLCSHVMKEMRRGALKGYFCCHGCAYVCHLKQAGYAYSLDCARRGFGGVIYGFEK